MVLVIAWVWYSRAVLAGTDVQAPTAVSWWEALRHALMAQLLWALYRGFSLTVVPNPAQAALVALALISLPWFLDRQRRYDLFTWRGYLVVQDWLLALGTVLVALAMNALWFLLLMHVLWVWGGSRVLAHAAASVVRDAQPGTVS